MFRCIFVTEKDETRQFCTHPSTHVCVRCPVKICSHDLDMCRILIGNPSTHPLLISELTLWVQERWASLGPQILSLPAPPLSLAAIDLSSIAVSSFHKWCQKTLFVFFLPDLFNLISSELAYDVTKERISFFCSVCEYMTVFTFQLQFLHSSVGETKMVLYLTCCEQHVLNMGV